jgi:ribonuclease P protein component
MADSPTKGRYRFTTAQRLRKRHEFRNVFAARVAKRAGPIRVHGVPSELGHNRIGFAVPKRAGKAVRRNRIKRLLREAFRLKQHEMPGAYDLVVVVSPHRPQRLEDYQRLLLDATRRLDRYWNKADRNRPERAERSGGAAG